MSDINERIANLSEEARALLDLLLKEAQEDMTSEIVAGAEPHAAAGHQEPNSGGATVEARSAVQQPARSLFKLPADRRALLDTLLEAEGIDARSPQGIPRRTGDQQIPLSFGQQRLWFFDQLEPGSSLYTIAAAIELTGSLSLAALEQSLNAIVRRHEALRTTFAPGASTAAHEPIQVIAPSLALALPVTDLHPEGTRLPDQRVQAEALRLIREEASTPFDLQRGPLIRASVLRLADDRHILLLTMHHIVSDGWSAGILVREIMQLYPAYLAGEASPEHTRLAELPIQYADYAIWQRGCALDRQLAYWKQQFSGPLPTLELPIDRPRPPVQTFRGATHLFSLPRALSADLQALSQREGVTLFMTLLAAFKVLLARYSGQTDIVVGTPIAGRPQVALEGLIGFFVNTLALRTSLAGSPTFRELLARVAEVTLGAYAHQDLPFEQLVQELHLDRDWSRSPLFQAVLNFQNTPQVDLNLPGLTGTRLELDPGTAKFDLTLELEEQADGLKARIEYNTDLFESTTIARMAGHFTTLLRAIVADPDARIAELPLLTEAERQRMLIDWNRSEAEYPHAAAVHQLFEAQAARTPHLPAIVFAGQALTYAELNTRANQLAHHLRAQGVGPDVLVALCVERSLEMIVGMLAILKAGGAYVPLDPAYPQERLQYMLLHSRAPVLLTQAALVARLPEHPAQVFRLDADWPLLADQPTANPPRTALPGHLAYLIFTSGSTGRPKGVMVRQQGLINLVYGLRAYFDDPAVQTTGLITSISFDISVNQIFPSLFFGRTLHIIPDAVKLDSRALLRYLHEQQVHLLDAVPSYMQAVLNEVAPQQPPNALRYLLIGGEKLEQRLLDAVFGQLGPSVEIVNIYGLTEISDINALGLIRAEDLGQPITVGRPLHNNRIYILNAANQPQPIGIAGEVCIAGESVSRGYLFRPDLTAERFVPCPFEDGQIMVRTGDLGRWLSNGTIEILGRIDQQVKIRGFRIEPGEIEAVLRQHEAIRECAVVAREDGAGDQRLVAYVVEHGDQGTREHGENQPAPSPRQWERAGAMRVPCPEGTRHGHPARGEGLPPELRQFLAARLSDYMLPAAFVFLDGLPKTPSGKLDRNALPAPDLHAALDQDFVAPRTPLEAMLAQVWADVLRVERVGVHDNFFALGGHSLLATQIVSRLRDTLQVDLPLRALFETLTIAGLAAAIAERTPQAVAAPAAEQSRIPVQPRVGNDRFPLSFAQQRLWLLDQLDPGSAAYIIAAAVRLRGPLNTAALAASLDALVARHETLRTTFTQEAGQPRQIIGAPYSVALPLIDLQAEPEAQREARVMQFAVEEARRPFDLQRGPLLRTTLLRLHHAMPGTRAEHVLFLTMHHIIADGWSMNILIDELACSYRAYAAGASDDQAAGLAPLPVQYADFAVWQRESLQQAPIIQQQLDYWKRQLAGAPSTLELPIALPRQAGQQIRTAAHGVVVSRELSAALIALSTQQHATLFMTLLAAFDILLYRYTGQTDLLVGVPVAGRSQTEIEKLIGFFLNTLVVRSNLAGNPSFVELLRRVRETTLSAFDHQDVSFEQVVKEVQPDRALHQQPLVQAVFVFQSNSLSTLSLPDLELSPVATGDETAKFDLTLVVDPTESGIRAVFKYNQALYPVAAIERMAGHFQTLLAAIVAQPEQPIGRLPLLTAAEQQRQLVDWNATAAPYPVGQCYHELFEAQVRRTPDAIAVLFGDEQLSYADLNARANQLAHHLRALGVAPESRVGICVERSPDLVVALLGTLKAGGAYVPLDPNYPQERLQFMLEDAQVSVLLTQRRREAALPPTRAAIVLLDADWPLIARQPQTNPAHAASVGNLAYVIYTSGSTGVPKGVMVTHEGIGNLAAAQINDFKLGPGSRVLQFVSFSFDGAVSEFVMALLSGATLCLALPGSTLPGPALIEQLREQAVTTMKLPPSVLAVLPATELPALRTLISAGEALPTELVRRWKGAETAGAGRRFFNAYGPSENTVCATIGECSGDEQRPHIGRPLPNKEIYLLDARLQPVPVGVPGELHIGGIGLARGYLDRPALTAEKFIPHPWSRPEGARLYKTGDLARYREDGNIEFVGRVDQQVKVRGFRIELGEIEAVLRQHPAVRECVAVVREDVPPAGGHPEKRLVAYVTTNKEPDALRAHKEQTERHPGSDSCSSQKLREFLGQRLPDYMVPSAFVVLDALPLTPNGKLDRLALPAPSHIRPELDTEFIPAQSWVEQTLARIWAETLRLEQIGIRDNFFDLGGDSILSIQITARANQAGLRLTPRQLFEHQTIAELAQAVGTQQATQAEQGIVTGPVPLTPIQQRFFEQEQPQPHHWNQSLLLATRQPLDAALLAQAIQQLVAHHDALRLRFVRTPTGWQQHNAPPDDTPPLITIDLMTVPEPQQSAALEAEVAAHQAGLDLTDGPLFRAVLFTLGPQHGSRLLLAVHHLVVDGVSWRTLLEDLQTAYRQISQDARPQLPLKTTAYRQWAERLADYAQAPALHDEWRYWRGAVPAYVPRLPLDIPSGRAANTEGTSQSVTIALDAEETRALLQDVPQVYHTQINDILLAAVAIAFKRGLRIAPLLIDLEGQGREPLFDDLDVSRTVGWFTTVFPVLLTLPHDAQPGDALKAIKEQLRRIPQRGIGYGLLRYLSGQPALMAALRAQPQAEVGFNYLGQFDQVFDDTAIFRPASESSGPGRAAQARRAHLLDINAHVFENCLQVDWIYSTAVHQEATIAELARGFADALRELIDHCLHSNTGGYTASDFSAFNWSADDLDDITSSIGKVMGDS
ncbi:MAG TPA: amino acid adenylation domain-containing protein [Herpetosiphonaceae bacterium]